MLVIPQYSFWFLAGGRRFVKMPWMQAPMRSSAKEIRQNTSWQPFTTADGTNRYQQMRAEALTGKGVCPPMASINANVRALQVEGLSKQYGDVQA